MTKLKSILNSFFMWVFVIAMCVNVAVASITIIDVLFSKNELIYLSKFIDSVDKRLQSKGYVTYETNKVMVNVVTNEWYKKHKESTND